MTDETHIFVRKIADRFPKLGLLLQQHLKENFGEILPHVFFGIDVTDYALELKSAADAGDVVAARTLQELLDFLEVSYDENRANRPVTEGDARDIVENVINVSFLEDLPYWEGQGAEICKLLGPKLTRAVRMLAESVPATTDNGSGPTA